MNSTSSLRRTSRLWSRPSVARPLLAVSLLLVPLLADAQSGLGLPIWMQDLVVQRIKVSGFRRVSYHDHRITGDDEAFGLGNYGGQGDKRFTDFGNVRITGRNVFNAVNFDFVIQDSRFQDPQAQKFNIDYGSGPWQLDIGDVRGSLLNTNRYASFNKTLRGVTLGYEGGGFSAKSLYSDVRGAPRTVTINGTNSAGPYYLQSAQIVRGSETVMIDDVPQTLGNDYTINYETGSITFVNRTTLEAKIVTPTSTIVATYEVFGFSGSKGRVHGVGLTYAIAGVATVGLTGMEQRVGGSGGLSTRLEKFQGFGPPSTPYFLQFAPLDTQPIVIRVNGILQTQDVDYFFDPDNPSIFFFNRFMASTDEIDVLYTPRPTQTVEGDRQSIGWDLRVPIKSGSGKGSISYGQAAGRLFNTPTPSSGIARSLDLRYDVGNLTLAGNVRDVPPGYVSIETVGFNRNEKAYDLRTTLRTSQALKYDLGHTNASISVRTVNGLGAVTVTKSRFTKLFGGLDYSRPGEIPIKLSHTRTKSQNSAGRTNIDTTDLTTSMNGKNWSSALTLQHQDARGPISATEVASVAIDTLALRTAYNAGDDWGLGLSTGLSSVRQGGESGTGRDIQANATWHPNTTIGGSLVYQDSDGGSLATLGQFSSGYGSGFGGSGFSSGTGSSAITSASKVKSLTGRATFSPNDDVGFGVRGYTRETSGSFSSNTRTNGVGFDLNWTVTPYVSLQTSLDSSRTDFLASPISTANTVYSAFLDGAPPGKWTWHAGVNQLFSGGGGLFNQDSSTLDFSLGYLLAPRHSLSLVFFETKSTGQFAQNDSDLSLNYQYKIWRSLALQASYRTRRVQNLDPSAISGVYRSSGFDVELVFNFGS